MQKQTRKYLILLSLSVIIFFSTLIVTKAYNNRRCYKDLENYLLTYSDNIKDYIDSSREDEYKELITSSTSALKDKDYSAIVTNKENLINFEFDLINSYNTKVESYISILKKIMITELSDSDKASLIDQINSLYYCKGTNEAKLKYEEIKESIYAKNEPVILNCIDEYNEFLNTYKDKILADEYYTKVYLKIKNNIYYINTAMSSNNYSLINTYINDCNKIISNYKAGKL